MSDKAAKPHWIVFDQIEIDVLGHRMYVDGVDVALERKAFAVLLLLASEPDGHSVVTRSSTRCGSIAMSRRGCSTGS